MLHEERGNEYRAGRGRKSWWFEPGCRWCGKPMAAQCLRAELPRA